MPVLITSRLTCSPLQEQDWPFFLALQQHPDVMRFVAEDRPVAAIREAFDSRLTPWAPGSAHWLCLVVRDTASHAPLGVTGYIHRGGIRRLTATVTAGNVASRRLLEKARFRLEGELRESYYLAGRWQNDWLFGLLQQEYLNNNS